MLVILRVLDVPHSHGSTTKLHESNIINAAFAKAVQFCSAVQLAGIVTALWGVATPPGRGEHPLMIRFISSRGRHKWWRSNTGQACQSSPCTCTPNICSTSGTDSPSLQRTQQSK